MGKRVSLCLLLGISLAKMEAAEFLRDYTNPTNGASVTAGFKPDTSRIIVGEPLFLTFVASNRAEKPFQFTHVRNEIFSISATNAAGLPVKSRYFRLDGNGAVSKETILSGKSYRARVFLNERCIFEESGEYVLSCRASLEDYLSRSNTLGQPIVTIFKLEVLPANEKRLGELIEFWGTVVETNGSLQEAALALSEINDSRTVPPLAALLVKDPSSYVAIHALERYTNETAADALLIALQRGEDYAAEAAGVALRKMKQENRAARALLPGLTNSGANIRMATARAISWTGSQLAFDPLVALLMDGSNTVRYAAAEAIGRLSDGRSFGALTNCLSSDDFALRIAAVRGLHALGRPVQPDWVKPMILNGGENIPTYYQAIDLLRIYGAEQAAPGLASCLHFDDPSVKHAYNFRLVLALESSPNGPKYYYKWHHDPNRDGTGEELADNRRILSELQAWLKEQKRD